jgi:hypothetical protein
MPSCVVYEISQSLGINVNINMLDSLEYRSRITATMATIKSTSVTPPYSKEDLQKIALYVNPDKTIGWNQSSLRDVLSRMEKKYTPDNVPPGLGLLIGNPTPERPDSVCLSTLYSWVNMLGGNTNYSIPSHELEKYYLYLTTSKRNLMTILSQELVLKDKNVLALCISIATTIKPEAFKPGRATHDEINAISHLFITGYKLPCGFPKTKAKWLWLRYGEAICH